MPNPDPPYILVIIDMQPVFWTAHSPRLRSNIIGQVMKAKKEKAAIIVVEYRTYSWEDLQDDERNTFGDIMKAIGDYPITLTVTKCTDNGAPDIIDELANLGWLDKKLLFVGVNYEACVYSTIIGMIQCGLLPSQIGVLPSCCNSKNIEYIADTTQQFRGRGIDIIATDDHPVMEVFTDIWPTL